MSRLDDLAALHAAAIRPYRCGRDGVPMCDSERCHVIAAVPALIDVARAAEQADKALHAWRSADLYSARLDSSHGLIRAHADLRAALDVLDGPPGSVTRHTDPGADPGGETS